jgi:hypothetical protein
VLFGARDLHLWSDVDGVLSAASGWSRALLLPFTGDELELETCSV